MYRQITAALTKEIVIGMKKIDFNIFSWRLPTLFANWAMARPIETVSSGTIAIHIRLLITISGKYSSENRSLKFCNPIQMVEPSMASSIKLKRID